MKKINNLNLFRKISSFYVLYIWKELFIYKCNVCGNEDERYIGYNNGKPYCRRCISFYGELADDELYIRRYKGNVELKYELSEEQKSLSSQILDNYKNHNNTLIYAVCGAGKTELVFKVIEYALKHKESVGFAIPRKDVVIELSERLKNAFPTYKIVSVYGGHHDELNGDIVCLTTHQLYRYNKYFNLLIMDEIDAFPFKDNFVLISLFNRSVKGNHVIMSATPSEELVNKYKTMNNHKFIALHTRYHKKPIPVPTIQIGFGITLAYLVLKYLIRFLKENKPVFIFTPTIEQCEILFKMLKIFAKDGNFVHSKRKERSQIIQDFKKGKYKYLVTTSVLERGVTFKNLQVIVYDAAHEIYSKETLIQISGRVGRVIGATGGEIIYVASKKSKAMAESIKNIEESNAHL